MVVAPFGDSGVTMKAYADRTVYVTPTGSKYHSHKCGRGNYSASTLSAAKSRGLTPCAKCFPGGEPSSKSTSGSSSGSGKSSTNKTTTANRLTLNASKITMIKGKTKQLKCKGGSGKISWKSSNKKVAKVSSSGKVKAVAKGSATITVVRGSLKATCKVHVETPKLSKTRITIDEAKTDSVEIRLKGCKHADDIEWYSSDDDVCDVDDGVLYADEEGTAIIKAKVHGVVYKCYVTVIDSDDDYDEYEEDDDYEDDEYDD